MGSRCNSSARSVSDEHDDYVDADGPISVCAASSRKSSLSVTFEARLSWYPRVELLEDAIRSLSIKAESGDLLMESMANVWSLTADSCIYFGICWANLSVWDSKWSKVGTFPLLVGHVSECTLSPGFLWLYVVALWFATKPMGWGGVGLAGPGLGSHRSWIKAPEGANS